MTLHLDRFRPLFVVGAHRSGTTWVANALCNHSRVFGIRSERYGGIVESWFFSHLDGRFNDISRTQNYHDFVQLFSRTPFFQVGGVSMFALMENIKPANYAEFFHSFMSLSAGTDLESEYWLEKTPLHTLYVANLLKYYSQAKFIAVHRKLQDVALSTLKLAMTKAEHHWHRPPFTLIGRSVYSWYKYHNFLLHYETKYPDRFHRMQYEQIVSDPISQFRKGLDFLGLNWEEAVVEQRFERNTSFQGNSANERVKLEDNTCFTVKIMSLFAQFVPFELFQLQERCRKPRTQEKIPFIMDEP